MSGAPCPTCGDHHGGPCLVKTMNRRAEGGFVEAVAYQAALDKLKFMGQAMVAVVTDLTGWAEEDAATFVRGYLVGYKARLLARTPLVPGGDKLPDEGKSSYPKSYPRDTEKS